MCAITSIKPGFAGLWASSTSVIDFFSSQSEPQGLNGKGSVCQIVSLHTEHVALALKKEPQLRDTENQEKKHTLTLTCSEVMFDHIIEQWIVHTLQRLGVLVLYGVGRPTVAAHVHLIFSRFSTWPAHVMRTWS